MVRGTHRLGDEISFPSVPFQKSSMPRSPRYRPSSVTATHALCRSSMRASASWSGRSWATDGTAAAAPLPDNEHRDTPVGGGRGIGVDDDDERVGCERGPGRVGVARGRRGVERAEIDVRDAQPLQRAVASDEVGDEVVRGRGEQAVGRVVLREVTADLEDRDAVAHLHRLVDVVGDEHDRLAQRLLQAQELVLQLRARDRVDRAERLVHQHDRRIGGEGAGDADALALAAGELARIPIAVLARRQSDEGEQLVDAVVDPGLSQPSRRGTVATLVPTVWCGNRPTCWIT